MTDLTGTPITALVPENSHPQCTIVIRDLTSRGTWKGPTVDHGIGAPAHKQLADTVWASKYAALYYFNRSPWVEHDYVGAIADVQLLGPHDPIPAGAWVIELLDTSDEPGALGYHEDQAFSKDSHGLKKSSGRSSRGKALHPDTGEEIPLAKVFVHTCRQDGVPASEVLTHELFEMTVDPQVVDETLLRVYVNPADGNEYIAEVGDPVQDRAWDVGAPEHRPCGVDEALIADLAYPAWWGQEQTRPYTSLCEELGLSDRVGPFEVAPGGYISFRGPDGEWQQVYGQKAPGASA